MMQAITALRRLPRAVATGGVNLPWTQQGFSRGLLCSLQQYPSQQLLQQTRRDLSSASSSSSASPPTHPPLFCREQTVQLPASLWKHDEVTVPIPDERDGVPSIEATLLLPTTKADELFRCSLGEGIIYDDQYNCVYWTDINLKKFYALELPSEQDLNVLQQTSYVHSIATQLIQVTLPQHLGSFAMLQNDTTENEDDDDHVGFLCAWEDGFQLCRLLPTSTAKTYSKDHRIRHWMDWHMSKRSVGEPVNPQGLPTRLNDGRCDPTGRRFICGGYYGGKDVYVKVFKCEVDTDNATTTNPVALKHEAIYENIQVTNSICFDSDSSDNTVMFLADSPQRTITKLPYNLDNGTLDVSQQQTIHSTGTLGVPDGSCIDAEGYLWNAVWRNGAGPSCAQRIHPETGEVVLRVNIPQQGHGTSQVACCCLGGKDLDILFLSTAAENRDLEREPHAGGLYAARVPVRGRPETRFVC